MLRELLAQNIARAFAEKPISKKELSEKIGVHPNIVGRWVSAGRGEDRSAPCAPVQTGCISVSFLSLI